MGQKDRKGLQARNRRQDLRIATFQYQGRRHVGLVSGDGQSVTPFDLTPEQARTGALPLIGRRRPRASRLARQRHRHQAIKLEAPSAAAAPQYFLRGPQLPRPCQGAVGLGFQNNNANPESWPIVFTKVPECVVGPHDEVVLPAGVSEQIDYESELAVVIGKGGRNIARRRDGTTCSATPSSTT
jgi:2-keto-4-pentenoate hydratase/2-oxohepta-3-ene-1,7-dioic acid hydratase in catechol pathway